MTNIGQSRRGTIEPIDLTVNFTTQHAWDSAAKAWVDESGRTWPAECYCRACGKNAWDGPDGQQGSLHHHVASAKHQSRVLWYADPDEHEFDEHEEENSHDKAGPS